MHEAARRRFGVLLVGSTLAVALACGSAEGTGAAYNCAYSCPAHEGGSSTYNTNASSADQAEASCIQAKGTGCPDPLCNCTKN